MYEIGNQSFDFQQNHEHTTTPFTIPDWDEELSDFAMISATEAPPLPPRNFNRQLSITDANRPIIDRVNKSNVDRLKIATKLYENVIENKSYDAELVAFFNMVNINEIFHAFETKKLIEQLLSTLFR